jgi:hypothetical protein
VSQESTLKRKLQVFISSTFTDLIKERQAAVSTILKSGHIPAGMELFTAGDKSQMTTIEKWIDESDVYMLILGGRYGSVEKTTGISYIELEYDYASQQGKPLFAVVITEAALEEKVKAGGTAFIEKQNQKELALFRAKVLGNISSFFSDAKDIKLCVHESLADFASNRDLKGWVSADDVEDTKPLHEEITKLRDENSILKDALNQAQKMPKPADSKSEFEELTKVLSAVDVKVPAALAGGKDATTDLLAFFYGNKEPLINGVTNSQTASEQEIFFYYNICPKLQVHGLVDNEKIAGVRYRRSFVTKHGNAFLSFLDKKFLLDKKTE